MKSYEEFLKEKKKQDSSKKDEHIELGIGNRDHTNKAKENINHIELGIGNH